MNVSLSGAKQKQSSKQLGFGLNARKRTTASNVFDEGDDEEAGEELQSGREAVNRDIAAEQAALRKRAQQAAASVGDSSIYDYDGAYDSFQAESHKEQQQRQPEERKSKYIQDLLKNSKRRGIEREAIYERKVAREQAEEDAMEEFQGKEKFITKAYIKKLEERQKLEAEEEQQRLKDEENSVTKQTGGTAVANFYGNLNRNVAMGGGNSRNETKKDDKNDDPSKSEVGGRDFFAGFDKAGVDNDVAGPAETGPTTGKADPDDGKEEGKNPAENTGEGVAENDDDYDEFAEETPDQRRQRELLEQEEEANLESKSRAVVLELLGDLPSADIKAPENVLFICKLNPATEDDDLELIFSRFDQEVKVEIIRDHDTGASLQYAFAEFTKPQQAVDAYFKMNNALVDDRRIKVDFSQSVAKLWDKYHQRMRRPQGGGSSRGGVPMPQLQGMNGDAPRRGQATRNPGYGGRGGMQGRERGGPWNERRGGGGRGPSKSGGRGHYDNRREPRAGQDRDWDGDRDRQNSGRDWKSSQDEHRNSAGGLQNLDEFGRVRSLDGRDRVPSRKREEPPSSTARRRSRSPSPDDRHGRHRRSSRSGSPDDRHWRQRSLSRSPDDRRNRHRRSQSSDRKHGKHHKSRHKHSSSSRKHSSRHRHRSRSRSASSGSAEETGGHRRRRHDSEDEDVGGQQSLLVLDDNNSDRKGREQNHRHGDKHREHSSRKHSRNDDEDSGSKRHRSHKHRKRHTRSRSR